MRAAAFLTDPRFLDITEGSESQRLKLLSDLRFYSAVLRCELTVPEGFEFEESIPTVLWGLVRPKGASKRAAAAHDWLYRNPVTACGMPVTRAQADEVYYELLRVKGLSRTSAWLRWLGVRLGGSFSWKGN